MKADCSRWLEKLSFLKCDPSRGVAPHKPLLLLVVLDLIEEGKFTGGILHRNGDLAFRFGSYWAIVAERRGTRPDVRLPFFHMRSDGFWKPLDAKGDEARDRMSSMLGQIDVSFLLCASDQNFRIAARRTLIAKYFADPIERATLYGLVGLEIPPSDVVAADARRYEQTRESQRKRDAKFSYCVLPAYDYTCALSRYRMIAINGLTPLDAAHIYQFKKGGSNHPTNGLALSKTAHWLFDKGFWTITDDYRIVVASDRFDEAGEEAHLLKRRDGNKLHLPNNQYVWPDKQCLQWHRKTHGFE